MKLVIDIPEKDYKRMKEQSMFGRADVWRKAIQNGQPLPDGAEILTKEAYSDLCTRAANVLNFESKEYIEQRLENYNKLLKSGILDCVKEKSQESEDKSCYNCKWYKTEKCQPSTCAMIGCDGHGLWEMIESEGKEWR